MSLLILIYLFLVSSTSALGKSLRIIGGTDADIKDFPHLASLRRISDAQHVCGGSIISVNAILTAAHCFNEIFVTAEDLIIYVGTSYVLADNGSTYLPEQIFIHPAFSGMENGLQYSNDIAIVKIKGVIQLNEFQKIIKLPTNDIKDGDIALLAGWGYTSYPSKVPSKLLQKSWMNVYNFNRCKMKIPFKLLTDQFCGFRRLGIGACLGDSGSPFVFDNKVIGVASTSIPCAKGIPDVYTNVFFHMDFITTVLKR